jgi:hypothetical protein
MSPLPGIDRHSTGIHGDGWESVIERTGYRIDCPSAVYDDASPVAAGFGPRPSLPGACGLCKEAPMASIFFAIYPFPPEFLIKT